MRKIVSLLLVLALLVPAMIACNNDEKPNDTSDDVSDTTAPVAEKAHPLLPEKTFGGATFTILAAADSWIGWYDSSAEAEGGDAVSQAVYDRNEAVSHKYDVELDYVEFLGMGASADAAGIALKDSISGDATYDLFVGLSSYHVSQILNNYLADLNSDEFSLLNLEEPWWYTDANKEYEVNGKMYMASNHFGVWSLSSLFVTFFNKTIQTDNNMEDFYELVHDYAWTIDKLMEYADLAKKDLDNDNTIDAGDIYGISSTNDYIASLKTSFGVRATTINEEGQRVLTDPDEKMIDVNDKIFELMGAPYYANGYDLPGDDMGHIKMQQLFANNQVLFVIHNLNTATHAELRNMDDYGIVPCPLYDEDQEEYVTRFLPEMVAIPAYVEDTEFSAFMTDALAYESYITVTPAYFEDAMREKLARDPETQKMLDIIIANTECDFTEIYSRAFSAPVQKIGLVQNYSTWFAQNKFAAAKAIETLTEAIAELGQE